MERTNRQMRSIYAQFTTRDDSENLSIEGYFAVFNSNYDIGYGMSESIAPGAFDGTLSDDVRALINHDTTLVLGRTAAHTLELRQDERGLWGKVVINPKDSDAMNLYERVKRGDVNQCSFGFDILEEETEFLENGDIHWTIKSVKLYEVSCCTFPAYEETSIAARKQDAEELKKRSLEAWKERTRKKLKGENEDGTQSVNAE